MKTRRQRKSAKLHDKIVKTAMDEYMADFLWFTMGRVDLVTELGDN
tara:strand:- start:9662 stop:9799 length:138 start_codon:yes stop_codon:yes gene_type:complete